MKKKDSSEDSFNMDQFLSFDVDKLIVNNQKSADAVFYRPSIIKDNLQSYESVIKFIYNPRDPNSSIINKWVVWLKNPSSDEGRYVDCPSSINKKSVLQDAFFACRNSDKHSIKDLQSEFKRTQQFFSLIQVVQDKQHPELEGQIRVFQYGIQIYDKIKAQIKPESQFKEPNNPFDVFDGNLFHLSIKLEASGNRKFPKYTTSEFLSKTRGLIIDGVDYSEKSRDNFNVIHKHLLENAPNLNDYGFKEWDDDMTNFVVDTINTIIPESPTLNEIKRKNKELFFNSGETTSSPKISRENEKKLAEIDLDLDDDDDDDIPPIKETKKIETKKVEKVKPTPVDDDDDDDDFFDDM